MTADAELPELVQDSQLQVTFCPNEHAPNEIRHKRPSGRGRPQKEIWVRERNLGGGGYGIVWLEKAQSGGRLRAVKEMRMKGKSVKDGPVRELEAIAKFSQDKVSRPHSISLIAPYNWPYSLSSFSSSPMVGLRVRNRSS